MLVVIIWLLLGSRFLVVFDRCLPGTPIPKRGDHPAITVDSLALGERGYQLILDSKKRLALCADRRWFTFGPVEKMWTHPVKPQYLFTSDSGDAVSFTRDVSRLEWHTPFAWNIMGVTMPRRHRYAYDRLRWTKNDGAMLQITWRDEQSYSPTSGWQDEYKTKLANLSIRRSPMEKAATAYLEKTLKWAASEYRLESQSATLEEYIVVAIYLQDETASHPGSGKSVVLRINKSSKKVVSETGFQ
jgi:hypothetical protein